MSADSPHRLSVCMMVKNEVRNLKAALESLQEVAHEFVIVDTGSTDGTQTLIQELSQTLPVVSFEAPWQDHFGDMRNKTLEKATGEWVFILDGDELFLKESLAPLKALLAQPPTLNRVYAITQWHQLPNGQTLNRRIVRLFPNQAELRFHGRVHEQLYNTSGRPVQEIEAPEIQVLNQEFGKGSAKTTYYAQLVETSLKEPEHHHPYLLYQQACLLAGQSQQPQELQQALGLFEQAIALTLKGEPPSHSAPIWMGAPLSWAYVQYLALCYRLKQHALIHRVYREALPHIQHREFFYYAGLHFARENAPTEAMGNFLMVHRPDLDSLFPQQDLRDWQALYNLFWSANTAPEYLNFAYHMLNSCSLPEDTRQALTSRFSRSPHALPLEVYLNLVKGRLTDAFDASAHPAVLKWAALYLPLVWEPDLLKMVAQSLQAVGYHTWKKALENHPLFTKDSQHLEMSLPTAEWVMLAEVLSPQRFTTLECVVLGQESLQNSSLLESEQVTLCVNFETETPHLLSLPLPEGLLIDQRLADSQAHWLMILAGQIPPEIQEQLLRIRSFAAPRLMSFHWQSSQGYAHLVQRLPGLTWADHERRFYWERQALRVWEI